MDEVIKIVIGLYNMNGEQVDREVMLACVMELMEVLDEDGNGLITREEFIENGLKSGFVLNLMEYFEDVPDPEPEKCKKPRCRKKCRCKPKDEDEDFQKLFHGVLALSGASNFYPAKVLP